VKAPCGRKDEGIPAPGDTYRIKKGENFWDGYRERGKAAIRTSRITLAFSIGVKNMD